MPDTSASHFVEREHELQVLAHAAGSVTSRGARLILVTGEAGLGKSMLHTVFQQRLDEAWSVEHVDGYNTDRSFDAPFGHLVGEIDPGDEPSRGLAYAVAQACRERVAAGPLLVVIEDLHFLDPVTVMALSAVLDDLADAPVLVVATSRPASAWAEPALGDALDALRSHVRVHELVLAPLTISGVEALLTSAYTGATGTGRVNATDIHERTGGNPFYVDAVLRSDPSGLSVPWTVSEMVLALLSDLGPAPRAAAELLAVEGGPLPLAVLDDLVGPDAVSPLEKAGLAVVVGSGTDHGVARLRHALVADAVRALLDPVTLARRHRNLAQGMSKDESGAADDLARHWAAAGEPRRAAPFAALAADRLLSRGSHARAAEMYELTLAHPPAALRERAALLERAASAASYSGRADQARRWGEAARQVRMADGRPWEAGRGWVNAVLLRSVEDAQGSAAGADSYGGEVSQLLDASQRAIEVDDLIEASRFAHEADTLAASLGDDVGRANAALAMMLAGDLAAAEEALVAVIERTEAAGDLATASVAWSRRARLRAVAGWWGECAALNDRGLALARRAGGPELWANLALGAAFVTALGGELDEALHRCAETDGFDVPLVSELARATRLAVAIERGELAIARSELEVLLPLARALGVPYYALPVLGLEARLRLLAGDAESAAHVLEEMDSFGWGAHHDYSHDILVSRAVVAALRGRPHELMHTHGRLAVLAAQHGGPQWFAAERFAAGLVVEATVGDGSAGGDTTRRDASAAYGEAAEQWELAPRYGWAADAWCAAARTAAGAPERVEARRRALVLAEKHGLERVRWVLACTIDADGGDPAAGMSPAALIRRQGVLARLTPREREVVELVAAGTTNKEIATTLQLSEKTVRNYLSSAFSKLSLTRRTEVAPLLGGSTIELARWSPDSAS